SDNLDKEKEVDVNIGMKEVFGKDGKLDFELGKAFANAFNGVSEARNFESKKYNDRSLLHMPFLATDMPF
ncbi:6563_t:CDS:1, partial [Cetraspora pellucida]